jgi:electron transfer flavoprotein alpha subunit
MYAGNIIADVELLSAVRLVSVRGTAFAPATKEGAPGAVAELGLSADPELHEQPRFGQIVSFEQSKADRPELADAEVVVSGGRALASAENFEKIIFPLADALKAGVGASRAAVDSGYAPNDWQVGQTGKVVAPNLYLAVGISGAIQHLAGMKDSKVIVAINKDPDAPIFEVADYGLVADLFEVAPQLTAAIKGS